MCFMFSVHDKEENLLSHGDEIGVEWQEMWSVHFGLYLPLVFADEKLDDDEVCPIGA